MRPQTESRNDKLLILHMFQVEELEQALAQAEFQGFEPHICGGAILFKTWR